MKYFFGSVCLMRIRGPGQRLTRLVPRKVCATFSIALLIPVRYELMLAAPVRTYVRALILAWGAIYVGFGLV